LQVLDPFEVADDDAAGVAEDVGDDEDLPARRMASASGWWGRSRLGEDAALELAGVVGGDDAVQGGGDEDFALGDEQFPLEFVAAGESGEAEPRARTCSRAARISMPKGLWMPPKASLMPMMRAPSWCRASGGDTPDVAEALDDGGAVAGHLESVEDARSIR
jgi:hypothetical protein